MARFQPGDFVYWARDSRDPAGIGVHKDLTATVLPPSDDPINGTPPTWVRVFCPELGSTFDAVEADLEPILCPRPHLLLVRRDGEHRYWDNDSPIGLLGNRFYPGPKATRLDWLRAMGRAGIDFYRRHGQDVEMWLVIPHGTCVTYERLEV